MTLKEGATHPAVYHGTVSSEEENNERFTAQNKIDNLMETHHKSPQLFLELFFSLSVISPPIPHITPKHSKHITSTTSTHYAYCLVNTQAKDYSYSFVILLSR